jgi:hypothetical protein
LDGASQVKRVVQVRFGPTLALCMPEVTLALAIIVAVYEGKLQIDADFFRSSGWIMPPFI